LLSFFIASGKFPPIFCHTVPGEPGEHVVRGALQIRVDLLLERVVVLGVHVDLDAGLLREGGVDLGERLLRHRVRGVRAEADRLRVGGRTAAAAGAQQGDAGAEQGRAAYAAQQGAAAGSGEGESGGGEVVHERLLRQGSVTRVWREIQS
jgi:hypothetical protein